MFYDGDLSSAISTALQERKAVLCFVYDNSTEASREWETVLRDPSISLAISSQTVAVRLNKGSEEAGFLDSICPITSTPAIIVIKDARVHENLQSADVPTEQLKSRLASAFGVQQDGGAGTFQEPQSRQSEPEDESSEYLHLEPASGDSNNAYEALRKRTQELLDDGKSLEEIFQAQLALLNNSPLLHAEVERLRGDGSVKELSESARLRLLQLPADAIRLPIEDDPALTQSIPSEPRQPVPSSPVANPPAPVPAGEQVYTTQNRVITSPPPPPAPRRQAEPPAPAHALPPSGPSTELSDKQKAQRAEYIKMQRDREQKQRDERERIKAQIKADREERRLMDEMRKQGQTQENSSTSSYARSRTSIANARGDVRVQVRTFDGSTLRNTFPPTSTITKDIRPWIDSATSTSSPNRTSGVPYNLKLILTPLPNRTIEAGEEDTELFDLGIVGSCTLVMVPVKGYVDSYASGGMGLGGGLLGGVVSGGYNLVSGTAGMVFGGVRSLLGYGPGNADQTAPTSGGTENTSQPPGAGNSVRIRTLADQRAEDAAKRDQQFYNGNQLNFQPNDEDHKKD
ncbi:hypothetical protein AYL99_00972 [Fonsecaea erecta]|uniref:UBX domain-containing protein n=1 Tax=Fonsecaea erecta TaxID=1367422 RepID=A0A178ZYQ8_9EURO|nr:hypothetical protein AYL99_00972 [Fonsecaea erecta]OAP65000.1 hypothetical protein AYL99_00972 [Fonsecaea erecta]